MPELSLPWRLILRAGIPAILLALFFAACESRLATQVAPTMQAKTSPAPSQTPAPTPPPLAAVVNGEWILQAEVDAGVKQVQAAREALREVVPACLLEEMLPYRAEAVVLERLIGETLLAQGARDAGFNLTDQALQERWEQMVAQAGGAAPFDKWLQTNGYTQELFQPALERAAAAAWQRDQIVDSVPETAEQRRARELLFTGRQAADTALAAVVAGETDFLSLAYQRDPAAGGDLGWFPRGYLSHPAIEEAVFSLAPGKISPVIQTPAGYHILLVTGQEAGRRLGGERHLAVQRRALADWIAARRAASSVEAGPSISTHAGATPLPAGAPRYIVRGGESLIWIAGQLGLSVEELAQANPQAYAEILAEGMELELPGRGSCPVELAWEEVSPGEKLESLARRYLLAPYLLARLNRWTSPAGAYTGAPLVVPVEREDLPLKNLPGLELRGTLLELSISEGLNPWLLLALNQSTTQAIILPGQALVLPGNGEAAQDLVAGFEIANLPLVQGDTVSVRVQTRRPAALSGWLDGHELHFFPSGENEYIALQGIHALAEPGVADFSLRVACDGGEVQEIEQNLLLEAGDFYYDPPLTVDPETIDPALTVPEEELVQSITAPATPEKLWDGAFAIPVEYWNCAPSAYGSRRSYNGSDYVYFHGGLDYGLCDNPHIFAPAAGVVVFTGSLTVRGEATIIDHGRGVYSGIWHQSEVYVKEGDRVEKGQLIGKIGATGRVTGEHLHWEVWVGGVQVSPAGWLNAGW